MITERQKTKRQKYGHSGAEDRKAEDLVFTTLRCYRSGAGARATSRQLVQQDRDVVTLTCTKRAIGACRMSAQQSEVGDPEQRSRWGVNQTDTT